jgi:hypothetical protein
MNSTSSKLTIYGFAAVLLGIFAIAAGVLAGAEFAIPVVILVALVLGFLMLNGLLARRSLARHGGDAGAAKADGGADLPAAHVIPDDRPLGDTAEAHDEISPHDLPKGAPNRRRAEAQAAARNGTTRGNREGAAGGRVLEADEEPGR